MRRSRAHDFRMSQCSPPAAPALPYNRCTISLRVVHVTIVQSESPLQPLHDLSARRPCHHCTKRVSLTTAARSLCASSMSPLYKASLPYNHCTISLRVVHVTIVQSESPLQPLHDLSARRPCHHCTKRVSLTTAARSLCASSMPPLYKASLPYNRCTISLRVVHATIVQSESPLQPLHDLSRCCPGCPYATIVQSESPLQPLHDLSRCCPIRSCHHCTKRQSPLQPLHDLSRCCPIRSCHHCTKRQSPLQPLHDLSRCCPGCLCHHCTKREAAGGEAPTSLIV